MPIGGFFQIFLSVILVISAISKFSALPSFRETLENVGIPKNYRRLVSYIIPVAEVAIAIMLLWEVTLVWGMIGLFLLLVSFAWSVWLSYSKGEKVRCNCFGAIADETLGWGTIGKIVLLGGAGAYILWESKYLSIWEYSIIDTINVVFISIATLLVYSITLVSMKDKNNRLTKV